VHLLLHINGNELYIPCRGKHFFKIHTQFSQFSGYISHVPLLAGSAVKFKMKTISRTFINSRPMCPFFKHFHDTTVPISTKFGNAVKDVLGGGFKLLKPAIFFFSAIKTFWKYPLPKIPFFCLLQRSSSPSVLCIFFYYVRQSSEKKSVYLL
jgi:hypothetical protein